MTAAISVSGLTRRYGRQLALNGVTVDFEGASITGLLGRNGAGKTTLMRIIAGHELASAGSVRVFGAEPLENSALLRRMVFIRENQIYPEFKVRHAIRTASWFYPNWCGELAETLLEEFDLPTDRAIKKLSHGMRSALGIVISLAARAEVTLLDEPNSGLDAVARRRFYDLLLREYAEYPRTVLLSTHLVDEVADLLERVVVIDHGCVVLDACSDDLRGTATRVSGRPLDVEEFVAGRLSWGRATSRSHESVVVGGVLDDADRLWARELHLDLRTLSLQEMMVHVVDQTTEDYARETVA
ncbi:MAG: ABC transporter ATP-binding protein [Actinobacteria bacterium]|nr:ABC transporter ATP-binding protein [Actinomycetota bacterium]